MIQSFKTAN